MGIAGHQPRLRGGAAGRERGQRRDHPDRSRPRRRHRRRAVGRQRLHRGVRYATETTRSLCRGLDLHGQGLAVVALVALAATTIEGGRRGFADPVVLGGFGLTALALGAFVLVESRWAGVRRAGVRRAGVRRAGVRRAEPMLPLGLFRSPTFASLSAVGLLVVGPGTAYPAIVVQLTALGLGLGLLVPAMTAPCWAASTPPVPEWPRARSLRPGRRAASSASRCSARWRPGTWSRGCGWRWSSPVRSCSSPPFSAPASIGPAHRARSITGKCRPLRLRC